MTTIEWTEETWNPTTGCNRMSPGCDNCYALTLAKRLKGMGSAKYQNDGDPRTSGPGFALTVHEDALAIPMHWKRPRRIFVNSMSDLFHADLSLSFINDIWRVMECCPQHTFQILTKRSKRMMQLLAGHAHGMALVPHVGGWEPLPNVWLGVSIESDHYTFRADHLRNTPAAKRFLSLEPLLGPLPSLNLDRIDWVIVGGESGPGARPMHPNWVRGVREQCIDTGTPLFFKQWGEWRPAIEFCVPGPQADPFPNHPLYCVELDGVNHGVEGVATITSYPMQKVGKHHAGRELDGRTWNEYPT